ncbi:Type 4 prepilin-like proteins leader peptide-processing enzyme [bioreactor metagenome]|uniref:Type 4 prepilin-like proteins leader peptide-processing enzyme n=1 Tax=bioreactor metagenome TaxID=1076179 RepID=A0A644YMI7_9ZZZZ
MRYPVIEVLTACLFILCFEILGLSEELIKALILTSFLIVITYIDYDHQLILDKILIWLAGVGVVINFYTHSLSALDMAVASLVGGGILLIIALASRGGMGGGDIKFAAALGLWFGLKITLLTLFFSFLLGGLGGILVLLFKLKSRKDLIPFGPFIAIAAYISMLYGNMIIDWYVKMYMR